MKQRIRLTESSLKRMIKESVRQVLNEWKDWNDDPEGRDEIYDNEALMYVRFAIDEGEFDDEIFDEKWCSIQIDKAREMDNRFTASTSLDSNFADSISRAISNRRKYLQSMN